MSCQIDNYTLSLKFNVVKEERMWIMRKRWFLIWGAYIHIYWFRFSEDYCIFLEHGILQGILMGSCNQVTTYELPAHFSAGTWANFVGASYYSCWHCSPLLLTLLLVEGVEAGECVLCCGSLRGRCSNDLLGSQQTGQCSNHWGLRSNTIWMSQGELSRNSLF